VSVVTGFLFRECSLDHLKGVNSCFCERVFPENSIVKGLDLYKLLNNHTEINKLLDDDVVRVCLFLALDFVFMGFELRHVRNRLRSLTPSSDEMKQKWWRMSLEYFHNVSKASTSSDGPSKKKKSHVKHKSVVSHTHVRTEVHRETSNVVAECMSVDKNVRNRLRSLTPSSDEMKQKWWRMSLEYFHNVSKASTSSDGPSKKKKSHVKHKSVVSHTHVRTEVHREVDVRTNVHRDVDEGLSVP
nr:phospholipase-like protein [Tanacetum cinerariifolium]